VRAGSPVAAVEAGLLPGEQSRPDQCPAGVGDVGRVGAASVTVEIYCGWSGEGGQST